MTAVNAICIFGLHILEEICAHHAGGLTQPKSERKAFLQQTCGTPYTGVRIVARNFYVDFLRVEASVTAHTNRAKSYGRLL